MTDTWLSCNIWQYGHLLCYFPIFLKNLFPKRSKIAVTHNIQVPRYILLAIPGVSRCLSAHREDYWRTRCFYWEPNHHSWSIHALRKSRKINCTETRELNSWSPALWPMTFIPLQFGGCSNVLLWSWCLKKKNDATTSRGVFCAMRRDFRPFSSVYTLRSAVKLGCMKLYKSKLWILFQYNREFESDEPGGKELTNEDLLYWKEEEERGAEGKRLKRGITIYPPLCN